MQIGRKLFFDIITGLLIADTGQWDNAVRGKTIDEEIISYPSLSERNRDTFDVIELPYGAYERDFQDGGRITGVNLETLLPIFVYPDSENPGEVTPPQPALSTQIADLLARQQMSESAILFLMDISIM